MIDAPRNSVMYQSVAVILTTYNGRKFIRQQLDSLLGQAGVSVHVYAFDDKSKDDTVSILRSYADENPGFITIFENESNSGGTGLNIFHNVHRVPDCHDFVALADQDDVWLPEKLQRAITRLSSDQADLYFSNLLAWDGEDEITGVVRKASALKQRDHLFGGGSAGCTYVMTRGFFAHLQDVLGQADFGGVRRISHDWLIYFLARHYGYKVCASPDALIKYRIHANSQYGGMSKGGVAGFSRRFRMLRAGFLREQIDNALRVAREGTEDREILVRCTQGRWSRLSVLLKYRFSLVRSKRRLLPLAFALLVFR